MLGDGSIVLHWVACSLDSVRNRLDEYGAGFFATEQRARPYDDLERLSQDMDSLTEHLPGELGPEHEAVAALAGARVAVRDIVEKLGLLRDPDRQGAFDVQKLVDATIEQVAEKRAIFDACRDRYMDAVRASPRKE